MSAASTAPPLRNQSLRDSPLEGVDSNFQYAEAVELVVAAFSCADCLGRVAVLRFSSFFIDIDRLTPSL